MRHPFRRKNLSPRLLPLYAVGAAALVLAAPTAAGFAVGLPLIALGLGVRAWGAGHLEKNARLTVSGPYARMRHPLYAGTLLIGLGLAAIAGGLALVGVGALLLPFFFGYYLPYKDRIESARLERRFGAAFAAYRAEVPALLPRWRALSPAAAGAADGGGWSARRFRDNDEAGTVLGVAIALGLLALRPHLAP